MDGPGRVNPQTALASAATYKKMKGKPGQPAPAQPAAPADTTAKAPAPIPIYDPNKPASDTNVLGTEHADGTVRQWGEDIKLPPIPPELAKKKKAPPVSDKAAGLSNTYYPANQQNQGKA